jgi:hypothetical protein
VLLGYIEDDLILSPLAIRWEPSGEVVELLDNERHGYGGEQGWSATRTGTGRRQQWKCPHSRCREHIFVACFYYHDEPPIHSHDRYLPAQDQFLGFNLYACCVGRDRVVEITGLECK